MQQLSLPEVSLFGSHVRAVRAAHRGAGKHGGSCFIVFEDDAVVNWTVIARVVHEVSALGEPWDVTNLYNQRWEGRRSWWMTDRAIRSGCVHRAFHSVGTSYAVGLLYSMRGAGAILSATERRPWFALSYDVWLGQLSQQQLLRIFYWGCTPPLRHNMLRSTVAHS